MPDDLKSLPEESFVGYAHIKDGKFVDAAELPTPERLPEYINIWNKVSNFNENSSFAIREFLKDNIYKNEEDIEKLKEEKNLLQEKDQRQLSEIDRKISEKAHNISQIKQIDSDHVKAFY